jgi:hypothetical protein
MRKKTVKKPKNQKTVPKTSFFEVTQSPTKHKAERGRERESKLGRGRLSLLSLTPK